jgi:hypothetical protein
MARGDFLAIFNRLAHFAPLLTTHTADATLDNLIEHATLLEPSKEFLGAEELRAALQIQFGLSFSPQEIQSAVTRLRDEHRLIPVGAIRLLPSEQARLLQLITEKDQLEAQVRTNWAEALRSERDNLGDEDVESLWNAQKKYLALVFERHGAQCASLIGTTQGQYSDELLKSSRAILTEAASELPPKLRETAIAVLPGFFKSEDANRIKYLAELLDNTFAFFSLTLDNPTALYVQREAVNFVIFLDSNVVLGLFDFHENPLAPACKELIELVNSNQLNVKLYISPATAKELRQLFEATGHKITGRRWTRQLSEAALECGSLSGIDLAFHKANAIREIDPSSFVGKLKHVELLAKQKGIHIYNCDLAEIEKSDELANAYAHYDVFLQRIRRPKPNDAIWHDMLNRELVRKLRGGTPTEMWEARYSFLTCDYTLIIFDGERRREQDSPEVASCILPHHFLQILRPILPRTPDFDKAFVETFAIPQFRTVDYARELICAKILRTMATFADVTKEVAVRILTDSIFTDRLARVDERTEEFRELIRERLLEEAKQATGELRAATADVENARRELEIAQAEVQAIADERTAAERRATSLEALLREREQQVEKVSAERQGLQSQIGQLTEASAYRERELREVRQRLDATERRWTKIALWVRRGVLLVVPLLVTSAFYWHRYWLRWRWLEDHPQKTKLLIGSGFLAILACAFVFAKVTDRKWHRDWYFLLFGLAASAILWLIDWAF